MPRDDYALRCPKCNKEKGPEWIIGTRGYSMRRLDVPYFMCGICRIIDINNSTVHKAISSWENDLLSHKHIPSHKELYREMMEILNQVIDYYCQTAGYKRAKFKKIVP